MQVTNIRNHRIRWRMLLMQGAYVGVISSLVMVAIAALMLPTLVDGADGWSFLKSVSTVVLGDGAATPWSGFEAGPVLVGGGIHLLLGAFAGMTYALLVAMFDLEGWTPVALFGLLYGAMLFVWSTVLTVTVVDSTTIEQIPVLVMFWGNVAFGLSAGVMLATWADRADLDQSDDERVAVFEGHEPGARPRRDVHPTRGDTRPTLPR